MHSVSVWILRRHTIASVEVEVVAEMVAENSSFPEVLVGPRKALERIDKSKSIIRWINIGKITLAIPHIPLESLHHRRITVISQQN